jgi:hypothetical protein
MTAKGKIVIWNFLANLPTAVVKNTTVVKNITVVKNTTPEVRTNEVKISPKTMIYSRSKDRR